MKKVNILLIILGLTLLSVGIGGYILADDSDSSLGNSYSRDGQVKNESSSNENDFFRTDSMMNGAYGFNQNVNNGELFDLDILTKEVEDYIGSYSNDLIISDIFIFKDSEYYFSIVEEITGRGAMELLVNPYTKAIFPEYGPNMMWNLKYGTHYNGGMMSGQGFTGRSGMMYGSGRFGNLSDDNYFDNSNFSEDNEINSEEAYNKGVDYLAKRNDVLSLGEEYHEFYGYYTFHVEKDGKPEGMLSVNGYTGEVWYHDWHGELIEIIEEHDAKMN